MPDKVEEQGPDILPFLGEESRPDEADVGLTTLPVAFSLPLSIPGPPLCLATAALMPPQGGSPGFLSPPPSRFLFTILPSEHTQGCSAWQESLVHEGLMNEKELKA